MNKPKLRNIKCSTIDMGDRARKNYKDISKLAADIEENGLITPIAVMELPDKRFKLLAGGRRLTAVTSVLAYDTISCRIYPEMSEYRQGVIEEAENLHRDDLTWQETAYLTKRLGQLFEAEFGKAAGPSGGHSQKDTADMIGVSKSTVSRRINLADALDIIPELANCKTESEAQKLLKGMEIDLITQELAKRAEHVMSTEGSDNARKKLIDNYIVKDFFEGVQAIPSKSVHCVELDPPYAIDLKSIKKDTAAAGLHNYNEVPSSKYVDFMTQVINESYRVLNKDGWLILWYAIHPWHNTMIDILTATGFTFCHPAVWVKNNGQTQWPDRYLASLYEPFIYARKGNGTIFKPGTGNVFHVPAVNPEKKTHPTERPIPLISQILQCFCPPAGRVLVPFAGSGNTLLAASNMSMSSIGWDLSGEYKNSYIVKVMGGEVGNFQS